MNVWIVTYPDLPHRAISLVEGGPPRPGGSPNSNIPTESTYENRIYSSNSKYLIINVPTKPMTRRAWGTAVGKKLVLICVFALARDKSRGGSHKKCIVERYVTVAGNGSEGKRPKRSRAAESLSRGKVSRISWQNSERCKGLDINVSCWTERLNGSLTSLSSPTGRCGGGRVAVC